MAELDDTIKYVTTTNNGRAPNKWFGTAVLDGTASPWKDVAVGSEYTSKPSETALPTLALKVANNAATRDWVILYGLTLRNVGQPMGLLLLLTHT